MYENKNLKNFNVVVRQLPEYKDPRYMNLPSPVNDDDPLSINLYAVIDDPVGIPFHPNETINIPTGIEIFMPRGVVAHLVMKPSVDPAAEQDVDPPAADQDVDPAANPLCFCSAAGLEMCVTQVSDEISLSGPIVLTLRNNSLDTRAIARGMRLATVTFSLNCNIQIIGGINPPLISW